ncbi:MAG: hypothetical protein QXX68_01815 [Candidatus Pacearchaeota archaeon]
MQLKILKTKRDKEEFLENDLIDRLIRIEQKTSAKFGKFLNYNETYCYKNLKPENKERYEKFLRTKKKKKFAFASIFLISLCGIFFISNNMTGRVISEKTGENNFYLIQIIFICFIFGIFFLANFLIKRKRKKRINSLFSHLEKIKRKVYK